MSSGGDKLKAMCNQIEVTNFGFQASFGRRRIQTTAAPGGGGLRRQTALNTSEISQFNSESDWKERNFSRGPYVPLNLDLSRKAYRYAQPIMRLA